MRMFLVLTVALALGGCASSPDDVRRSAAERTEATVEGNYQAVHRRLLAQARKCFTAGMITGSMGVEHELYTDIRQGTVSVVIYGGFGPMTFLVVDIEAIDEARSRVIATPAVSTWERQARKVPAWAAGTSTDC